MKEYNIYSRFAKDKFCQASGYNYQFTGITENRETFNCTRTMQVAKSRVKETVIQYITDLVKINFKENKGIESEPVY